jgi:exonuclease III
MDSTTILYWNIRGLNAAARHDNVQTLVTDARPHIVCLVETKLSTVNQWSVASMLGANYTDFAYVPAAATRGNSGGGPYARCGAAGAHHRVLLLHGQGDHGSKGAMVDYNDIRPTG